MTVVAAGAFWPSATETGMAVADTRRRTIERRELLADEVRVMVRAVEVGRKGSSVSGSIDSRGNLGPALRTNVKLRVKPL